MKVHILGPHGSHDVLLKRLLLSGEMAIRPTVVYNWLLVRNAIRGASGLETYAMGLSDLALPPFDAVVDILRAVPGEIAKQARKSADMAVELSAGRASDIAGVRLDRDEGDTEEAAAVSKAANDTLEDDAMGVLMDEGDKVEDEAEEGMAPTSEVTMENVGLMNCVSAPEAATAGAINALARAVQTLDVPRDTAPLNEFVGNGKHLMEGFWYLFLLGRGLTHFEGSINASATRHLMLQYSNRFQRDSGFVLILANQLQRHAVLRGVSMLVKNQRSEEFVEYANDPNLSAELEEAASDPNGPMARKVMRKILPLVAVASRPVPWGAVERGSCISKLLAMMRRYGPISLFLTMAPDDAHNPLGLRLSMSHVGQDSFPSLPGDFLETLRNRTGKLGTHVFTDALQLEDFLQKQAARNPASSSLLFDYTMRVVLNTLMGTPTAEQSKRTTYMHERRSGVVGTGIACFAVVEETGKGCHHLHCGLWVGAMPGLVSGAAIDAEVFGELQAALDAQFKAQLPRGVHVAEATRRALGRIPMYRAAWDDEMPPATETTPPPCQSCADEDEMGEAEGDGGRDDSETKLSTALQRRANICAAAKQWHKHCHTCHKLPNGECGCRLAMPAGHPVPRTRAVNVRQLPSISEEGVDAQESAKSEGEPRGKVEEEGGEQRKAAQAKVEGRFPSAEVHIPAEELSCAGAMPGTSWFLQCRKGCHPTGLNNKSVLHTGDLWLTVSDAQKEHSVKRREAIKEKAAMEQAAAEEGGDLGSEVPGKVGTAKAEGATPKRGLPRLVPKDPNSSLVLELQRPTVELSDWPALQDAAGKAQQLKGAELRSVWQDIYSSAPDDVRDELGQPEWAEVKTRLQAMTEEEMHRVVVAWADRLPCANASVTCFNQVLTSILQSQYSVGAARATHP